MTQRQNEFDLFLSYHSRDFATVKRVASALTHEGCRVFLDRWYLAPGLPWPQILENILGRCRAAAIFVGSEGLGPWQLREHYLALDRQSRDGTFPVIPVLLPGADPPLGFLRLNTWIDLRAGIANETGLALLRSAARGLPPDSHASTESDRARADVCPYRGLQVFREEDASFFRGREQFTQRLAEAVKADSFVALVGASGSGKSSVVRAGLLPLLRAGADDRAWEIALLFPGDRPLQTLAASLVPKLEPNLSEVEQLVEIGKLADHFQTGAVSLRDVGCRVLDRQPGSDRLLVVVDQWEELYTLCTDEAAQQAFVGQLLDAARDERLKVVITLRGDFFAWTLADRGLADALEKAQVNLGPMRRNELERAVRNPAAAVGLELEPGLVDRILDDVRDEPGNLPLLEFVLSSLWERRRGATLHFEAYRAIGGVQGAVAERADRIFERQLTPDQQRTARRVLMRMVRPGAGTLDTRKRIPLPADDEMALAVVRHLADARLVVTGRDTTGETLEVTHEALIQNWGRLRAWVDADRGFLLTRERVEASADLWEKEGRATDRLLSPGRPLAEAEELLADRREELAPGLVEFIQASVSAERARQTGARAAERRRLRRARLAAGAMAALALVAIALGVFAYRKSEDEKAARLAAEELTRVAESESNLADRQRQTSVSRLLAQEALRLSETGRSAALIENAAALAVESWRRRKNPTAMAAAVTLLPMLPQIKIPHGEGVNDIAYSADGTLLVAASEDGSIQVNDAASGAMVRRFPHGFPAEKLKLSPDGRLIASSHKNEERSGDEPWHIGRLLETETGREIASFPLQSYDELIFSPDSRFLAFASSSSEMRLLETESGNERLRLRVADGDGVTDIGFSNDSRYAAVIVRLGPSERSAYLVSTARGEEVGRIEHGDWIGALAFSPDSRFLTTAHHDGYVRMVLTGTGEEVEPLEVGGTVSNVHFSPNGQFLALSYYGRDEDVEGNWLAGVRVLSVESLDKIAAVQVANALCWRTVFSRNSHFAVSRCHLDKGRGAGVSHLIDTETGALVAEINHEERIAETAFSDDGRFLATASEDGTASLVATEGGREIARLRHDSKVWRILFSPDGDYLVTDTEYGGPRVFDTANGEQLTRLSGGRSGRSFAFSPGQPTTLAWADLDGSLRLYRGFHGIVSTRIAPSYPNRTFAVGPQDRRLASIDQQGILRLSTIPEGKVVTELKTSVGTWAYLRFSPDGEYLAASPGIGDAMTVLLESRSGRQVTEHHSKQPVPPTFSRDSRFVAAYYTSDDGRGYALYDLHSRSEWLQLPRLTELAAFSPDSKLVAAASIYSAGGREYAAVFDTASGQELVHITIEGSSGWVQFGPSLRYLVLGERHRGTLRLEDVRTREVIATIEHGKHAWSRFSPDGSLVATASDDGSVKLLDTESGNEILHYSDPGGLDELAFSSDSRYLGTMTREGHARLLECGAGKTLKRFSLGPAGTKSDLQDVLFSPKNSFAAFGRWHGNARLLATNDGRTVAEISELGSQSPSPLLFSRDERYLAVIHEDEVVSLYDTRTGKRMGRIRHDRGVHDFSFSRDGRFLFTLTYGDVLAVVSTETGAQVARYDQVSGARFVLGGEMIAIGGQMGIKLYPSDPQILFESLCARAGANLSEDEWADYVGTEEPLHATCPNWANSVAVRR